jgi:hypothetical protein
MSAKPFHFEGKVDSVSRSKRGTFIRLEVSEAPAELLGLSPGQRLMVGASPLGDFDEDDGEGERAVQLAGILCRSQSFWKFIEARSKVDISVEDENDAAVWLRGKLGIDSRSDLKHNAEAREQLRVINEKFQEWADKTSL